MDTPIPYEYVYQGTLDVNSPTYTKRKADDELHEALKAGEFCYVFNARKMGKSSVCVQTMRRLQNDGIACAEIDLAGFGTDYETPDQWYSDIIETLTDKFDLDINWSSWLSEQELLSPVRRFSKFIETILLVQISQNNNYRKIVIFFDEIDTTFKLKFSRDDFFALIRACYNQRAYRPIYNCLTFCLVGVAAPSDLIADKQRTPFNIGKAIELTGFTLEEAKPSLMPGLQGKVNHPEIVLQEVLNWTGGQPFLTQKVCSYLVRSSTKPQENEEAQWVEEIVKSRIITNWQSQDQPEYLRTMLNRIIWDENEKYRNRLLGIYQRILLPTDASNKYSPVVVDESKEQVELRLSGLIVKNNVTLKVYNRIYESIFDWNWVEKELAKLRPYAADIKAWYDSGCTDKSRLLRGQALRDARAWAIGRSLGDRDYQFLAESEALEKRQAEIALEQEKKARELQELEYKFNIDAEREKAEIEREKAEIEREKAEAKEQANNVLKKAFWISSIILGSTLLVSLFVGIQAEIARQNAITATRLEQNGINLLQQVDQQANTDDLLSAMRTGRELKSLVKQEQSLADYPAYSPVFSLQTVLINIREKNSLEGHSHAVTSVVYSPVDKTLAFARADNTIELWNAATGKLIATLTGHTDEVNSVVYSPDGKTIASASFDKTIKLWSATTGKLIATLTGHTETVTSVVYSPDGKTIASASGDKSLVSGSGDNTIKLWNATTGKLIDTLTKHTAGVTSVVYSPNAKTLAFANAGNTITLWDLSTGKVSTLTGHTETVWSVVYSLDGKTIASASGDKTIKLWSATTGKLIDTLTGHTETVNSVVYSPDGKTIASASFDNTIKLWNATTGKLIATLTGHGFRLTSVVYSPDGKTIASANIDKTIKLLDATTGKLIATLTGHGNVVRSVVYSPNGKTIASASVDDTIELWNATTGKLIYTLTGHGNGVNSVVYSPNGKTIASASVDRTIKLLDATTGKLIDTLTGHTAQVKSVVYSPDGKTIASASVDRTIKLWDATTGKLIDTLTGHTERVKSVVYSPDGKIIASGSGDKTIKLWNATTGKLIYTLTGHTDEVTSVVYSPDGKTLASASIDKTIKLWNLDLDSLLAQGCSWLDSYLATHPDVAKELCPKQ